MEKSNGGSLHTAGVVSEYFSIEGHIASTRCSDIYKAIDLTRRESVCLTMLRHPLVPESEAVVRFMRRMEKIEGLNPPISKMQSYGVDADGRAFVVLNTINGGDIASGNVDASEAERRFMACVRTLSRLHAAEMVCGDLCPASFFSDRSGDVTFVALMGVFDAEAAATAMLPAAEVMPYMAPECLAGAGIEKASDVFSLGVLGYYLLTKNYPYGQGMQLLGQQFNLAQVPAISEYVAVPPIWAEEVLKRCLSPDPRQRYQDAAQISEAITDIRQRSFSQASMPATTMGGNKSGTITPGLNTYSPAVRKSAQSQLPVKLETKQGISRRTLVIVSVLVAIFGALVGHQIVKMNTVQAPPIAPDELALSSANPEVKEAVETINKQEASKDERLVQVDKLKDSDDPVAQQALLEIAKSSGDDAVREYAEKAILERARRKGYALSAEQVHQFVRTVKEPLNTPGYEAVLKVLDPSLPPADRDSLLREAYRSNPQFVLRLAVALAFDSNNLDSFSEIIAQLVGDSLQMDDLQKYSPIAAIMAHPELALIFEDRISQNRNNLKDEDIKWILDILARRDDINTRAVANLALERNLLPPVRAELLKIVRDRSDLNEPGIINALVRAASGGLMVSDLSVFGRWYDQDVEKILLLILAAGPDRQVAIEAFDTLAGKSPTLEPSTALLSWVRSNYWDQRGDFTRLVGIVGTGTLVPEDDQLQSFAELKTYMDNSKAVAQFLATGSPVLMKYLLAKHSIMVDLGSKLNLLKNPDKSVRIAAVDSLETNDIGALRLIVSAYEAEKDPEVKEHYQKFWFIKDRGK